MQKEFQLIAIDWGPGPVTYLVIWTRILGAWLSFVAARALWKRSPFRTMASVALLITAAILAASAVYELYFIYRYASWPAFSLILCLIPAAPVAAVGLFAGLILRRRGVPIGLRWRTNRT
jgi:hypothetical protein